MALTKDTLEVNYEVIGEYKRIRVLMDTVIKEDGKELSRAYHRHVVTPDISAEKLDYMNEIDQYLKQMRQTYEKAL